MHHKSFNLRSWSALFLCFWGSFLIASAQENISTIKRDAVTIASISDWCSQKAEFATVNETFEAPQFSCLEGGTYYQKWFRFKATTSKVEIGVESGGAAGTLSFPYLALFDGQFRELGCSAYTDEKGKLPLSYLGLQPGETYYLAVLNHNKSTYQGTFSLCITDAISNDFVEGAIELKDTYYWCSEKGAFSTANATPDQISGSCLGSEPNFNRWFKFSAVSNLADIEVKVGDKWGTASFPYLTILDKFMKEVACAKWSEDGSGVKLHTEALTPGEDYFLSVDHQYNTKHLGTFTLCFNASKEPRRMSEKAMIIGKLTANTGKPHKGGKVQLLTKDWDILDRTETDANGKFRFVNLDPDRDFLVKVQMLIPEVQTSVFEVNSRNRIIKRTIQLNATTFGFDPLVAYYDNISLIDFQNIPLQPDAGKAGLIGQVVEKDNPLDAVTNLNVFLFKGPGEIMDSTRSDIMGRFSFKNIPNNPDFLIKFGGDPSDFYTEMFMVNDKREPIMSATSNDLSKEGYFHFEKLPPLEVSMENLEEDDGDMITDFSKIDQGKAITLNNIHFKYGDHSLLERSFDELNRLVKALKERNQLKIEVSGHSDNLGSDEVNQKLSELRAKTVVNYLIANGIDKERLSYKGFGGSRPIATNSTEQGRQQNRRVEFRVLK